MGCNRERGLSKKGWKGEQDVRGNDLWAGNRKLDLPSIAKIHGSKAEGTDHQRRCWGEETMTSQEGFGRRRSSLHGGQAGLGGFWG